MAVQPIINYSRALTSAVQTVAKRTILMGRLYLMELKIFLNLLISKQNH